MGEYGIDHLFRDARAEMHSIQIVVLVVRDFVDTRKIINAISKDSSQNLHVSEVELHLIIQWCDHDIIVSVMFFEKFVNLQKNMFFVYGNLLFFPTGSGETRPIKQNTRSF
jgi:phosphatidylserine/phosphatidylglycerophosphate/cardiolipin synthase-like enzyme